MVQKLLIYDFRFSNEISRFIALISLRAFYTALYGIIFFIRDEKWQSQVLDQQSKQLDNLFYFYIKLKCSVM